MGLRLRLRRIRFQSLQEYPKPQERLARRVFKSRFQSLQEYPKLSEDERQ